jgi:hypothetical protein
VCHATRTDITDAVVLSQAVVEAAFHQAGESVDPREQVAAHALFVSFKNRKFGQQFLV